MSRTIGIDLGTTYSAMAYVDDDGQAQIIQNREGERITPSVVLFDSDGPVVGTVAKSSAIDMPLSTVQFVKRRMGERTVAFRHEDGSKYSPEEVSALILKRLKEDAEEVLGEPVSRAVITVPAYFNDAQRKATEDAGRIAGVEVIGVINEPTAAALAYGMGKSPDGETALVYDLGGGTFDVTVLKVSSHGVEVLATAGDKNLGGFDWDNALINLIAEKAFGDKATEQIADPGIAQTLRDRAEVAKKTLSGRPGAMVRFAASGENHRIEVSREEFEAATASLIRRTERLLNMTVEEASLDWAHINRVLLVGGSSRMPAVASSIKALTGSEPSRELHPDEVVAMGAAHYAQYVSGDGKDAGGIAAGIEDVCSHSLGIITHDPGTGQDRNSIVLIRNTKVPCEASDVFSTVQDGQVQLNLRVTQGEDADISFVHVIGESTLSIPPYPKGAPLRVTFRYDENGLIYVAVHDMTADKPLGDMQIERQSNLGADEVTQLAQRVDAISVN